MLNSLRGDMSPEHVTAGDTALHRALPLAEPPLSIVIVGVMPGGGSHQIHAQTIIGRDPSCDVVIADRAISRAHLRLVPRTSGIEVVDLDSSGTFVDGHPTQHTIARAGATIRIGNHLLLVVPQAQLDAMAPVRRAVALVAPTMLPVVLTGEPGTGKEVIARAIHAASGRRGPFVAVNCAVERDLSGFVAMAHEGTLFLEEPTELPSADDVRFIATHGSGVEIALPALRHRREDIPALVAPLELSPDALEALLLHAWPNNLRELDTIVRGLPRRTIELVDLPQHLQAQLREARRVVADATRGNGDLALRARVVEALQAHRGNVRRVSLALQIGRGHLYRLLKRFELDPGTFRSIAGGV